MRNAVSALFVTAVILAAGQAASPGASAADTPTATAPAAAACPAWLNQDYRKLHSSQKVNICQAFAGKPLLIVNTASHCGYTPQFKGLEAAWQKYKSRGLVVVGFASDDFNQEDADEAKAAEICFLNNGVTFTMLAPMHVTGTEANSGIPRIVAADRRAQLELQQVPGAGRRQGAAAPRQQGGAGIRRVRGRRWKHC